MEVGMYTQCSTLNAESYGRHGVFRHEKKPWRHHSEEKKTWSLKKYVRTKNVCTFRRSCSYEYIFFSTWLLTLLATSRWSDDPLQLGSVWWPSFHPSQLLQGHPGRSLVVFHASNYQQILLWWGLLQIEWSRCQTVIVDNGWLFRDWKLSWSITQIYDQSPNKRKKAIAYILSKN